MTRPPRRRLRPVASAAFVAAGLVGGGAAWAASGVVHDDRGRPIEGAQACAMLAGDAPGICVTSDANGRFRVPADEEIPAIRISAPGFLPVQVASVDHVAPIALARAASFDLAVVDAEDGAAVRDVRVWVLTSDGRRRGPIELGTSGKLAMRTFAPGRYLLHVEANGYRTDTSTELALAAGDSADVVVRLRRDGESPAEDAPSGDGGS